MHIVVRRTVTSKVEHGGRTIFVRSLSSNKMELIQSFSVWHGWVDRRENYPTSTKNRRAIGQLASNQRLAARGWHRYKCHWDGTASPYVRSISIIDRIVRPVITCLLSLAGIVLHSSIQKYLRQRAATLFRSHVSSRSNRRGITRTTHGAFRQSSRKCWMQYMRG